MRNSTKVGVILAGLAAIIFVGLICDAAIKGGVIGKGIVPIDFEVISNCLFNQYGAALLILGGLMFGAIIAGVTLSKEEEDD